MAVEAVPTIIVSGKSPENGKSTGKIAGSCTCIGPIPHITYCMPYAFNLHFTSPANLTGHYHGKRY